MNCRNLISLSVRRISRSSVLPAVKTIPTKNLKLDGDDKPVPAETDTEKLANYVCGTNLFIEGEDIKLKPDSEYPEWLWKIEPILPFEQLDENSRYYWKEVQRRGREQEKYLKSLFRTSRVHK